MESAVGVGGVHPGWRQAPRDFLEPEVVVGLRSGIGGKQALWLFVIPQLRGELVVPGEV